MRTAHAHRRVIRPGVVPTGFPVRADRAHPLCPTVAYLPGLSLHDLCGAAPPLAPQPATGFAVAPAGPASRHAAANSFLRTAAWPSALETPAGSVFVWFHPLGNHASNPSVAGLAWPVNSQPFMVMGALASGVTQGVRAAYNNSGSIVLLDDNDVPLASCSTLAVTYEPNASGNLRLFPNGLATRVAGGQASLGYTPGVYFCVGGDGLDPTRFPNLDVYAALWWPRALSAAEVAALHRDPLCWLSPAG